MPKFSTETKIFAVIIAATLLLIGGAAVFFGGSGSGSSGTVADQSLLVRPDSHVIGPANAKVTIVEFSDFQCPACVQADPTIKQVLQKYDGQIRFAYRDYPLPSHVYGRIISEAAEAAGLQGKFWEMHDKLFANYQALEGAANEQAVRQALTQYASDLGLDTSKFTQDLDSDAVLQRVTADQADGNKVGLAVTPTFFINGTKFDGALSLDQFSKEIDSRLK